MQNGLMMDYPLTLTHFIERARLFFSEERSGFEAP